MFEKDAGGGSKVNCETLPKDHICAYYTSIQKGKETTGLGEYNNECYACKFYGQTGTTTAGTTTITLLGYEKKPCTQGMYSSGH